MFDTYSSPVKSTPRGALQIELHARETEKQLAILAATYSADQKVFAAKNTTNPIANFLASIFSGLKTQNREFTGPAQITLANQARK